METAAKNVLYERRSFGKTYTFIYDFNKRPTFPGKFAKTSIKLIDFETIKNDLPYIVIIY